VRLAELAKKEGVGRFLFSSSCSTYGAAGEDIINEQAPFNPVTPYGRSKVMAEQGVSKLAGERFSPVFLRSATAYGVSPKLRFDLVLNNLVAWAYTTGKIYLKSDGTPWRPIVHIEDISRAFTAALEAPRDAVHNEAFNVGSNDQNYQIKEIAGIVKKVMPDCVIEYAEDAGPDKRCYRIDCRKITGTLPDFKVEWDAEKGVKELYETYKKCDVSLKDFEGPRYKRVKHLKRLLEEGKVSDTLRWKG
jgi:nucleoside-diphosphate-sugar epimerase